MPYLTLVKDLLRDFSRQNLRGLRSLQDLVLAKRQQTLQDKLPQRESHEHVLPWEERPVKKTRKLLANKSVQFLPQLWYNPKTPRRMANILREYT